jgi:3-deoxy-D-manno-octulosonic-acid transferase
MPLFFLYRWLTVLGTPLIRVYLALRLKKGKEDPTRCHERIGVPSLPRPEGMLVWMHAASMGETISVLPLITELLKRNPQLSLLLTTGTVTSAALAKERLPARAIHQYIPVDIPSYVESFVAHWKPNLAVWVESEFWPNLMMATRKQSPMILLNARISDNSFVRWQRYGGLCRTILSCFSLCLPQSPQDEERLQVLGAPRVRFIGNLKDDAPPLPFDAQELKRMQQLLHDRPLWLAASTHSDEETQCAATHQKLKVDYPGLLTIIVPRHARRGEEIATTLTAQGFSVALRSKQDTITPETDIYLADTMGELGLFYRLAQLVFIGGSLIPHGGQNPLEAVRLGAAVILGPHMENFEQMTSELAELNAALRVNSKEGLYTALSLLLSDGQKRVTLAENALKLMKQKNGIVATTAQALSPFILSPSHTLSAHESTKFLAV